MAEQKIVTQLPRFNPRLCQVKDVVFSDMVYKIHTYIVQSVRL